MTDERVARALLQAPSWDLSDEQVATLELILTGAFDPLDRLMSRAEAESVAAGERLPDGTPWPAPITLRVSEAFGAARVPGEIVALRDAEGVALAALHVGDAWRAQDGSWHLGGTLERVQLPSHGDFAALRMTPDDARAHIARRGWSRVIGVFPGMLLHRGHEAAIRLLADRLGAGVLVLVPIGGGAAGSLERVARVQAVEAAVRRSGHDHMLAVLPLAHRAADERDWRLCAIVARNYGCTHLAFCGDAAVSPNGLGRADTLGLELVALPDVRYREQGDVYVPAEEPGRPGFPPPPPADILALVDGGHDVPAWMIAPEVVAILQRSRPPRWRQGFTVFFTGLSGSGKSTMAVALRARLLELTGRPVTLLDGDLVRKHLSSELGFSREHRDLNILRIGYVASEITRHRGIALCAPIAPYDAVRKQVRRMIEPLGGFVLVHVATPLDVCEQRDRKGLYAKARAGLLPQFTGVSDPYEPPDDAAITLDTSRTAVANGVDAIAQHLIEQHYLGQGPEETG